MNNLCMTLGWLVGRQIAGQLQRGGEIPAEWETVLETTVTTAADDSAYGINATLEGFDFYNNPEWIYRVTVGDETITGVPVYIPDNDHSIGSYYSAYILGNRRLMSEEHEDSGGNFCITELKDEIFIVPAVLTTRTAGTYRVKVEKLLKAPVAYSYNGTRLPKIPVVDGYSHAYITISETGPAKLVLSSEELGFSVTESAYCNIWGDDASLIIYLSDSSDGWTQNSEATLADGETYTVSGETLTWANFNVYAPETFDTVFESSMPVPIFDYKEW